MKHPVQINGHDLPVREYKRQRVVTFEDVDTVHKRAKGTARRNFNKNVDRFIEGKHYFRLEGEALSTYFVSTKNVRANLSKVRELVLVTEKGYLLLVKSLNDDTAWRVQEQLIDNYFRYKETLKKAQAIPEWQQARQVGKETRLKEMDELKQLVEYARAHGSRNADQYYKTYTSMVNAAVRIRSGQRNELAPPVLQALGVLENIVCTTIVQEIEKGTDYHEIYNLCKGRVKAVSAMITLPHNRLLLEDQKGAKPQ